MQLSETRHINVEFSAFPGQRRQMEGDRSDSLSFCLATEKCIRGCAAHSDAIQPHSKPLSRAEEMICISCLARMESRDDILGLRGTQA